MIFWKIKKGMIIALTEGEYADFRVTNHAQALRDFNGRVEIARFKKTGDYIARWSADEEPSAFLSTERFVKWAVKEGLFKVLTAEEVCEWHLGSYKRLGE